MEREHSQESFTLIELSVVLVISGLIVGGVLVGKELIDQATARKVISDIEKFKTAVYTFEGKYNCLPGDCANATQFWDTDSSCPNTPNNSVPKTATCNGNGDGKIGVI